MKKILILLFAFIGLSAMAQQARNPFVDTLTAKKVVINGNEVPSIPMTEAERVEALEEDMALSFYGGSDRLTDAYFSGGGEREYSLYFDPLSSFTYAISGTSLRGAMIVVKKEMSIDTIGARLTTAGDGASLITGVAIYSTDGSGGFTKLSESTDDVTHFQSVGDALTPVPSVTLEAGLYAVVFANLTPTGTQPVFGGISTTTYDYLNCGYAPAFFLTSYTSFPATFNVSTNYSATTTAIQFWIQ